MFKFTTEGGGGRKGMKKELKCVIYVYQLPMMNVIVMCYKHTNKKLIQQRHIVTKPPQNTLLFWYTYPIIFATHSLQ